MTFRAVQGPGRGARHLCCSAAEALCCCIAESCRAGQQQALQTLMLLPQTLVTVPEQQVLVLCMGRLLVSCGCDAQLSKLMLPLLTDALTRGQTVLSPRIYACSVQVIAQAATASAHCKEEEQQYMYRHGSAVLVKLYNEPTPAAEQLLMGSSETMYSNALSHALLVLAEGMQGSSYFEPFSQQKPAVHYGTDDYGCPLKLSCDTFPSHGIEVGLEVCAGSR